MNSMLIREQLLGYCAFMREAAPSDLFSLDSGVDDIVLELRSIALDAQRASRQGIELDEAANDPDRFRALAELHRFVSNMLTMTLTPELAEWVYLVARASPPPQAAELLARLARYAAQGEDEECRALARVLLFELLRLEPLLQLHLSPHATFGVGMKLTDVDAIALAALEVWLEIVPKLAAAQDVNPVNLMSHEVELAFGQHVDYLRRVLTSLGGQVHEAFALRAGLEATLAGADAADAILVRNGMPEAFEVQHLSYALLKARNPQFFGDVSEEALRKRAERLRNRMEERSPQEVLVRAGPALLDIVRDPSLAILSNVKKVRQS
jgi:hypothetical protein